MPADTALNALLELGELFPARVFTGPVHAVMGFDGREKRYWG